MFQTLYDSQWQFPYGVLLLQLPLVCWILVKRASIKSDWLRMAVVVMILTIFADTVSKAPWLPQTTAVAIAFVVAGDLRFFVLFERWQHCETPSPIRWIALPLAIATLFPLAAHIIAQRAIAADNIRVLFLIHEWMFVMLALGMLLAVSARSDIAMGRRKWLARLCGFQVIQYTLWASADVVILLGGDLGYLLRVVPNLLYYVAFVPFAWLTAPEELR